MGSIGLVTVDSIAPGDVGFVRGSSSWGEVVARITGYDVAHTVVYHRRLADGRDGRKRWLVAEMSASRGARFVVHEDEPVHVVRVWRDRREQRRLLGYSRDTVRRGAAYDWAEIGRCLADVLGRQPYRRRLNGREICTTHALQAILYARPDLSRLFPDPDEPFSPGSLHDRLVGATRPVRELRPLAALRAMDLPAMERASA